MYHVYVLKSEANNKIYIGHTQHLEQRVKQHQNGYDLSTKPFENWELVHTEDFPSRNLAVKREKFLKSGDGRRVLKLKGIL